MPQPFFIPRHPGAPASCALFLSGSGTNAEKVLEYACAHSESPFQVVVLVTDRPQSSRARVLAQKFACPLLEMPLKSFYLQHGLSSTSLATVEGRRVRELWSDQLRQNLLPYAVDFGVFAGFVPLCSISRDFPCLNVHPGDLTRVDAQGVRRYVGLHATPVAAALADGEPTLRSSVILAMADGVMDSGPLLSVSPPVTADYQGASSADLRGDPLRLHAVAEHNLARLKEAGDWTVLPPTVADFAAGCFAHDGMRVFYRASGKENWQDTVVEYAQNGRTLLKNS